VRCVDILVVDLLYLLLILHLLVLHVAVVIHILLHLVAHVHWLNWLYLLILKISLVVCLVEIA